MIVFFFLMAGLLFIVLNSGEQINHKVQMQSAADAATATGAGWFARGLNVVSMCNVANTQLLSLIVLCDALESVVPPAQECIDDLVDNIGSSKAGHDIPIDSRVSDWLVVGNAASEREIVRQFADVVAAVDWNRYLTYDTGVLWECVKLMDGFAHTMARETPEVAQREAIDIAQRNGAEFGFILPLWPALPVQNGQWQDFRNPMQTGRMPPPKQSQAIGGFRNVMGYLGYRNQLMGPWSFWREPFTDSMPMGLFDISRFAVLFRLVSERKLDMMFGDPDTQVSLRDWEMDYDTAKGMDQSQIRRAWWESVSFDCRYPFPENTFFSNMNLRHEQRPIPRVRAYANMDGVRLTGYTRAREAWEGADPRLAVWYRVRERETAHYPQLGIFAPHPPTYPDGSPWEYQPSEMQTYYAVNLVRFDGAEIRTDESLHRRYLPPGGTAPFAPIMFDRVTGENLVANINNHFTFNGFAYRSGQVENWRDRFENPNPNDQMVAYAQARVFCRWSHDLFTQHWRAKLMRADRWKYLLTELDKGVPSQGGSVAGALTADRLDPVRMMIEAYDEEFVAEVTH
jgi:hypothetical protein